MVAWRLSHILSHSPVYDLDSDYGLREYPLQDIEPASPAIENAALPKKRIKEHQDGSWPAHEANAIRGTQLANGRASEIVNLTPGIGLLGAEPTRHRLAVVVKDAPLQLADGALDHNTVAVTAVAISR